MVNLLNAKIDSFIKDSIFKLDDSLVEFNKFTQNIMKSKSLNSFGSNIETITRNLICDGIIQNILAEHSKSCRSKSNIEYLDYSYLESDDIDFLPPKETREIVESVIGFESKNIICGTLTSTLFIDSANFIVDAKTIKNNPVYKMGSIESSNIIVYSYIRNDDHSIFLSDGIYFNIIFDDISESDDEIKIDYRLSINIIDSKYIKVLLNTKSQDYSIYNISKRKAKLNKI